MKVVYTCIANNYDKLVEVKKQEGWDYICFTTDKDLESDIWKIVFIENSNKIFRHVKICPNIYLPNHEISVWIDANLEFLGNLDELAKGANYKLMKHPGRTNIFEEANACIKLKKDSESLITEQINHYISDGYAHNMTGLVATGIIIRKSTVLNSSFNEHWWDQVRRFSKRDQLSFNYVAWKLKHNYTLFPFLENCQRYPHLYGK